MVNDEYALRHKGDRVYIESALRNSNAVYYVYVLFRPDGKPFYVGKGTGRRIFQHESEARQNHPVGESNPYKCNVIRKILRENKQLIYGIDSFYSERQENACLQRETALILKWKRLHEGGCLTNLAGGIGSESGSAPLSLEKHEATLSGFPADNLERATLNQFLQGIGPVKSVPIKPISQIARILPSTPHSNARKPTLRAAYALIASASANGCNFSYPCVIPRRLVYKNVEGIIENGVSRDILKAGMADLVTSSHPTKEQYSLDEGKIALLIKLYGADKLEQRGLL